MTQYQFEYTNQKYLIKLFCISALTFFLSTGIVVIYLVFITPLFTERTLTAGIVMLILCAVSVIIPFVFFLLHKKKAKTFGTANLYDTCVEIATMEIKEKIDFRDITKYLIEPNKGLRLRITLWNERKVSIVSNYEYCNTEPFILFCKNFDQAIKKYKIEHKADLVKEKITISKKWLWYYFIIITIFLEYLFIVKPILNGKIDWFKFCYGLIIPPLFGFMFYRIQKTKKDELYN